jgi:hypothetical protein
LENPTISADRVLEYFNVPVLSVMRYEAQGRFFKAEWGLGSRIFEVDEAKIPDIVNKSDFLLVTPSTVPESPVYPFDIQMERLRPRLIALCAESFFPIKQFSIYRRNVTLCVRSQLTMQGDSGGWITGKGLDLRGVAQVLRERPTIEISGLTNFAYLSKVPTVTAELLLGKKAIKPIPATLERSARNANAYIIRLHLNPNDLQDDLPVQLHLSFDTYFVPNELGLNSDLRRLVMRVPTKIALMR